MPQPSACAWTITCPSSFSTCEHQAISCAWSWAKKASARKCAWSEVMGEGRAERAFLRLPPAHHLSLKIFGENFMSEKDDIKELRPRMDAVIEDVRRKLATVRTGRAAVSLLDTVMVEYYGTPTPLSQMASVHVPEPQMLTVQPWDQT